MAELNYNVAKKADLIYDVGLYNGDDTAYYLKRGFKVIAFEADPDSVAFCRTRFKNELEAGMLIIVEGAIVNTGNENSGNKHVTFYKNIDQGVWGTVDSDWVSRNKQLNTSHEAIQVPVINFSECVSQFGVPYYLKIDIEGMDTICLNALLPFKFKPDYISIESEKKSFRKLVKEISLFKKMGYQNFMAINQALVHKQKVPADSKEGITIHYEFPKGSSGLFGSDLGKNWKSPLQITGIYLLIFLGYWLIGDSGILKHRKTGSLVKVYMQKIFRTIVPGWYDTHVKLGNTKETMILFNQFKN